MSNATSNGARRFPMVWASGLLALGALLTGTGLKARAADGPPRQPDLKRAVNATAHPRQLANKVDDTKKDDSSKPGNAPRNSADADKSASRGETSRNAAPRDTDAGSTADRDADVQRQIDDLRRQIDQLRRNMERGSRGFPVPPNFPAMPNFPAPDLFGRMQHGRLGVMVAPVGEVLADQLNLKKGQGLVVQEVRPDSPAAKAGLKPHDILVEMDGKPVPDDFRAFAQMVSQAKAGTPMNLVVIRKGKPETIKGLTLPEAREPRRPAPAA